MNEGDAEYRRYAIRAGLAQRLGVSGGTWKEGPTLAYAQHSSASSPAGLEARLVARLHEPTGKNMDRLGKVGRSCNS